MKEQTFQYQSFIIINQTQHWLRIYSNSATETQQKIYKKNQACNQKVTTSISKVKITNSDHK
jgi:hypothetical protein